MRYAHADRVFSCPRSFLKVGRNFTSMARNFDLDEILPSDAMKRLCWMIMEIETTRKR